MYTHIYVCMYLYLYVLLFKKISWLEYQYMLLSIWVYKASSRGGPYCLHSPAKDSFRYAGGVFWREMLKVLFPSETPGTQTEPLPVPVPALQETVVGWASLLSGHGVMHKGGLHWGVHFFNNMHINHLAEKLPLIKEHTGFQAALLIKPLGRSI